MRKKLFGNYEIDTEGNLFNVRTGRKLIPSFRKSSSNRFRINLYVEKEKMKKSFYLHLLIVSTFVDEYNNDTDRVHFIDGNFRNCALANLKVTRVNNNLGLIETIFPKES